MFSWTRKIMAAAIIITSREIALLRIVYVKGVYRDTSKAARSSWIPGIINYTGGSSYIPNAHSQSIIQKIYNNPGIQNTAELDKGSVEKV